jgi:hypothetical protein
VNDNTKHIKGRSDLEMTGHDLIEHKRKGKPFVAYGDPVWFDPKDYPFADPHTWYREKCSESAIAVNVVTREEWQQRKDDEWEGKRHRLTEAEKVDQAKDYLKDKAPELFNVLSNLLNEIFHQAQSSYTDDVRIYVDMESEPIKKAQSLISSIEDRTYQLLNN